MMIKIYIKQAWVLLKQNPLFSTLYIVGTGLAIAVTMTMAIAYYVKIAPIYPEVNREHTLYLTSVRIQTASGGGTSQSYSSYKALQEWFYPLKNVECVSAVYQNWQSENYIQPADQSGDYPVQVKLTDTAFFRIYDFRFIEGKPFTQADFSSGIHSAVITDEMARRLFDTDRNVTGRMFKLNYMDCKVAGVVKAGSYLTPKSYAQIYLPYTIQRDYDKAWSFDYLGNYQVLFLVKSAKQEQALHLEVENLVRKVNLVHAKEWKLMIWKQPISHLQSVFQAYPGAKDFSVWGTIRHYLLIILVLLLVPALNLSGMISSRMETRLAEMGVRKSFGAHRSSLLSQVMWENLLLTLIGGLFGMLLAWGILYTGRVWVFSLFESMPEQLPDGVVPAISGEMLFAPIIFISALVLCIILNMLSAIIPAWRSLHKPIINSLNEKR
jgi:putative ABC transport system permease protein